MVLECKDREKQSWCRNVDWRQRVARRQARRDFLATTRHHVAAHDLTSLFELALRYRIKSGISLEEVQCLPSLWKAVVEYPVEFNVTPAKLLSILASDSRSTPYSTLPYTTNNTVHNGQESNTKRPNRQADSWSGASLAFAARRSRAGK